MNNISVVIPVYNEERHIADCLNAIINNTVKPLEIIVADGGSEDKTAAIAKSFKFVKVLPNPQKTAGCGRNTGIRAAKGDIIAFTDGDCIVDKHWIENIQKAFSENELDGIGGKVIAAKPCNRYEAYWNKLAWSILMSFGDKPYMVEKRSLNDCFVTANCAYKKKLLYELNGFDKWFGNNAEDTDLSWRAFNMGAKLMYYPDAKIYAHGVKSLSGIRKKSFRNGVSSSKLQKRYGSFINYDVNIYKVLFSSIGRLIMQEKDAWLDVNELVFHLLGKYYGSLRCGIINV